MKDAFCLSLPCRLETTTPQETEAFGVAVATMLQKDATLPAYVALRGDLGVGKTVFVRGFTSVLAPGVAVRSPTFALVNEYRPSDGQKPVFHFDMYRITDEDDLYSIGYEDYLDNGYCLVEWSENIPYALPQSYLRVTIQKTDPTDECRRILTLEWVPERTFAGKEE